MANDLSPITSPTIGTPWPDQNNGLSYNDVVSSSDSGATLLEYYASKYKYSAPPEGWLQRIKNKQIAINGVIVTDPNVIVRAESKLVYCRLPWKEPDCPYLLQVLYEDCDMVAINKPSGLQVLPGGLFQQRTVLTQLQWQATKQRSSSGSSESHPVPVHRLGRGTSGILLCAKSKVAKTCLAAYFADGTSVTRNDKTTKAELTETRKILKVYRALVTGILHEDEIVIKQPIGMVKYPGVAKGLYVASPSGKSAWSKVNVLERVLEGNVSVVQVEIQSGRPHQIRIHLAFIGHPLLGDPLYVAGGIPRCPDSETIDECFGLDGGYRRPTNPVPGDCGYHLHAHQVILLHPTLDKIMKISAPLPIMLQTSEERCFDSCSSK